MARANGVQCTWCKPGILTFNDSGTCTVHECGWQNVDTWGWVSGRRAKVQEYCTLPRIHLGGHQFDGRTQFITATGKQPT